MSKKTSFINFLKFFSKKSIELLERELKKKLIKKEQEENKKAKREGEEKARKEG